MTRDIGIARKMMENRLYRVAAVSQNLALSYIAHSILGLPRSYRSFYLLEHAFACIFTQADIYLVRILLF